MTQTLPLIVYITGGPECAALIDRLRRIGIAFISRDVRHRDAQGRLTWLGKVAGQHRTLPQAYTSDGKYVGDHQATVDFAERWMRESGWNPSDTCPSDSPLSA